MVVKIYLIHEQNKLESYQNDFSPSSPLMQPLAPDHPGSSPRNPMLTSQVQREL